MANTFISNEDKKVFNKSIFTLCGYRNGKNGEKCHPGQFKLQNASR